MGDHPLEPPTDRCLCRLLPYQLANQTQTHQLARAEAPFNFKFQRTKILFGISTTFAGLSQTKRQIIYALLTRSPVYLSTEMNVLLRLACVKHAASVRPEPESNSPLYDSFLIIYSLLTH